jgi:hypothetical protein
MSLAPRSAALWFTTMVALGVSPLVWSQELKPIWNGSELRVTAPRLRFLTGKPLESLRNGRAVAFDFLLTLNAGANTVAKSADRFVISYDLWEEKFSVTRLPRDSSPRKQIAHLTDEAAQSWCLDNIALPTKGVASDQPLTIALEVRAADLRDAREILTDPGISLTALIEIFSRQTRTQQPKWNLQHGPVRLSDVKQ